jgi:hypothetical protein
MNEHGRPRPALAAHAAAVAALLLAACSGPAGPTSAAHSQPPAGVRGGAAQPSAGASGGKRQVVLGETLTSDLVLIDPRTGGRTSTIASGGLLPPSGWIGPVPQSDPASQFFLVVRDLRTGAETAYPAAPQLTQSGFLYPIDHLSWSADGRRLLVSLEEVQDNEGWALAILDTRTARYYRTDAPGEDVPVTGDSSGGAYYREGVFMPDGNLFVNRVCCAGLHSGPLRTSTLMWEVTTAGARIKEVAIGFADRDHTSLDVDPTGAQLLYLSGTDLYVSDGGQRPRLVTSGLLSAAFISR